MRKNFGAKPWMYPMPVLIIAAYDKDGNACCMNAAWGGISEADEISMCLSPGHKTVKNILETKAFTVSMATADTITACDYVGIVSGNSEPDKMEKAGFTTEKAQFVSAPVICQLPMALECELISYDPDSCRMVGKIKSVNADEAVLTDGKIDPMKLKPITFDPVNNKYLVLGEAIGNAFSDGNQLK